MTRTLRRLPPGGVPLSVRQLGRTLATRNPGQQFARGLAEFLSCPVGLFSSGREAMRVALSTLAERSGRREVIVPAYTCFSIPAAAVAAGLRVRLVDVDARARIDLEDLARLPLADAAGVIVSNLFGVPESVDAVREVVRPASVAIVDDAAQSLGATARDGVVGARGDAGILSFGRGKPLSALGGGALAWAGPDAPEPPPMPAPRAGRALLRGLAYDLALHPIVFAQLSAVPSLGIGTTVYDPDFSRGAIAGDACCLGAAVLPEWPCATRRRQEEAAQLATEIRRATPFEPLVADLDEQGVYPRLALMAPTAAERDDALDRLGELGASAMYPSALSEVKALARHLVGDVSVPGARDVARRLLTLPTHGRLDRHRLEQAVRLLGNDGS